MIKFNFNKENAVAATLYILNKVGRTDFHKLFKILYFAEQYHLSHYGKPITGDRYVAMVAGPVPSIIYDMLESIRDKDIFPINYKEFEKYFTVEGGFYVFPLQKADTDYLSESQIEALNKSIEENKGLNFSQLKDKSHDAAWGQAEGNMTMGYDDIAACGGANDAMLSYLRTVSENQTAKFC